MANEGTVLCQICREPKKQDDIVPAESVPEPIAGLIRKEYPAWSSDGFIIFPLSQAVPDKVPAKSVESRAIPLLSGRFSLPEEKPPQRSVRHF